MRTGNKIRASGYDLAAIDTPSKGRFITEKELEVMSKHLKVKKGVPTKEQIADVGQLLNSLLQSDREKKEVKNFIIGPGC
jgi:hypothetical protein